MGSIVVTKRLRSSRCRWHARAVASELWHEAAGEVPCHEDLDDDSAELAFTGPAPPEWLVESFRTNSRLLGLLWLLSEEELRKTVMTMHPEDVEVGESLIVEGEVGSTFYIIESGSFSVFKSKDQYAAPGCLVGNFGPGSSFGELALLYNQARSATVVATSSARVWVMGQQAFQKAVSKGWKQKLSPQFIDFLQSIPIFEEFEEDLLRKLGRALIPKWFMSGQEMIKQGQFQDCFFILRSGEAMAVMQSAGQEVEIERYTGAGTIIGKSILMEDYPRQQEFSVKSISDVTVAFWMSKMTFDNVLGARKEQALARLRKTGNPAPQCVCM